MLTYASSNTCEHNSIDKDSVLYMPYAEGRGSNPKFLTCLS